MLKNIPPILGPELLQVLRAMGHGDELVIADANFPATSVGPPTLRVDGVDAVTLTDAILTLMPLQHIDRMDLGLPWKCRVAHRSGRREPGG